MIRLKILFILLITLIFIAPHQSYGQSSYRNIKVDDLNDEQVRELVNKAQSLGYNDDQAVQIAASNGLPSEEISKLKIRIQRIRQDGLKKSQSDSDSTFSGRRSVAGVADTIKQGSSGNSNVRRAEMDAAVAELAPKIFGEDLFRNGGQTFEPNLRMATPKSYVIGPDDELLLDLTGDNEASYRLKVGPEGTIKIQYAGIIAVAGLTIENAEAKLKANLAKTYPAIKSGNTRLSLNIGNIRSIKVTLVGEVRKPGSYTLPSLATVFNALYLSGGPNRNGSFRKIQIVRNNHIIQTVDIYDFLLKGIQNGNIRLQDQDVINVPVYEKRVEVAGEVKRPAFYEMKDGESFDDLIRFFGGFSSTGYTASVKVIQNTSRERQLADISKAAFGTFSPSNGDKFVVESILNRFANRVQIAGAVFRPGQYELKNGLTLKALIRLADGLKEDAFLNRAYILRLNKDNTASVVSVNLNNVMQGTDPDPVLQREDKISVNSLFDLRDEYIVEVKGEVRLPGTFKYADNMSVESAIQMAGGLKPDAVASHVEVSRRVGIDPTQSGLVNQTAQLFTVMIDPDLTFQGKPFILQPYDIVSVRASENYRPQQNVTIRGEVRYPGNYTIERKDERISDLIRRAGGLTTQAFKDGASLKRPGPPEHSGPGSRDSISRENDRLKLLNLKRLQTQNGVNDTSGYKLGNEIIRSYMVGIDLSNILNNPGKHSDLLLQDGDILTIPAELQTVRVSGEVLKPTNIVFEKNMSMSEYINQAGGYSNMADKSSTYIEYANGSIKSTKKFLFFRSHPSVKPGAEIFVPQRAPREKLGITGLVGITTALASLAAIIVVLLRK